MGTKSTGRTANGHQVMPAQTPGEAAKARVYAKGMTLKQFASKNGLSYRTVSEVVRGVNKGLFGEGHRAAVALGIKRGA